jgi:phenylalanyl-tRNA synthetase alpha chain
MIQYKKQEDTVYQLKPEGEQIARDGSHEARFWAILPPSGSEPLSDGDIAKKLGNEVAKLGKSQALKARWAKRDGSGYVRTVSRVISLCSMPATWFLISFSG